MKNVVLLGSTGSIGTSTIKVAEDLPDRIRLIGLGAGNNADLLFEQAARHRPQAISIIDPAKAQELHDKVGGVATVFSGADGLVKLATMPDADIVLIAIVGTAGLRPALAAIRAGKDIAEPLARLAQAQQLLRPAGVGSYGPMKYALSLLMGTRQTYQRPPNPDVTDDQ